MEPDWTSPNGKIVKFVVSKGDWTEKKPYEMSECLVQCLKMENEPENCHFLPINGEKWIKIGQNSGQFGELLDQCLMTMYPSEVARFQLSYLPKSTEFTLKMVEVKFAGYIYQWTIEEKRNFAQELKNSGVELYKKGQYRDGAVHFIKAVKILASATWENDENANNLKAQLYSNLASYYLRLKQWEMVVRLALKAAKLAKNQSDQKAKIFYKLGVAQMGLRAWDEAKKAFQISLEANGMNKAIEGHMKTVNLEIQRANEGMRVMWQRAFK